MTACSADCAITRIRERERQAALALAEHLHPGFVWRSLADREPAIPIDALGAVGRRIEALLPVRAIVRPADRGGADAVYLLAGLHAPCLCEIADGTDADLLACGDREETYVRIVCSPHAALATLQEVRVVAGRARGTRPDASLEIVERPLAGVEDRRLRDIVKGVQGTLRKAGLTLLDMAFLLQTPPSLEQGAYERAYDERPTLFSLLFDPTPPAAVRTSIVTSSARADTCRARA